MSVGTNSTESLLWPADAKDSDPTPAAELSQHLVVDNFAFSASPVVGSLLAQRRRSTNITNTAPTASQIPTIE